MQMAGKALSISALADSANSPQNDLPIFIRRRSVRAVAHGHGELIEQISAYVEVGKCEHQVIDVMMSKQRDTAAARRFFTRALRYGLAPVEVTTDKAGPYLRVVDEMVPAAAHVTEQYDNNPVESDHARLRPMRGMKQMRSAARIAAGHAFVQNLRRGHYELTIDVAPPVRLAVASTELAQAM